jgi:signal transduction histidine kinase
VSRSLDDPGGPPKLYRVTDGRMVAGVSRGLAIHLGVDPLFIRLAFVLLAFAGGAGLMMYAAFWAFVPLAPVLKPLDPTPQAIAAHEEDREDLWPLLALAALVLGLVLLLRSLHFAFGGDLVVPVVLAGVGVALLWRQADDAQRARWRTTASATASAKGWTGWARTALGGMLVAVGLGTFLAAHNGFRAAVDGLLATVIVLGGVALVAGPWLLRLGHELSDERRERIRSQERAEIAAHVHDSVLQTLTLIQRSSDDAREVQRLARAEERELRQWLYLPAMATDASFGRALERLAAEAEDSHSATVEVVVVRDCPLDEGLRATLLSVREAIVNAAKYANDAGPIRVYAEVEPGAVEVFVRDRGPGFDLPNVPDDRLGVRQSIVGRMERNGGKAEVRTAPGEGTEVRLQMPRSPTRQAEAGTTDETTEWAESQ